VKTPRVEAVTVGARGAFTGRRETG
jgi:hypothetical protein